MTQRRPVKIHSAKLTPVSDTKPKIVKVDDSSRLREIRALVEANNQSSIGIDVIICQIYMESRFDKDAHAQGSSARGLMQLLKAGVSSAETIVTCKLGPKPSQSITVVRASKIASTHVYYLQYGKVRTPFFGSLDNSRGSLVHVQCVGKKRRALIVSGEFTANALQGFAIANSSDSDRLERLDFAEKNRPMRIYLAAHEMSSSWQRMVLAKLTANMSPIAILREVANKTTLRE